jgi:hypothetical protein
MHEVESGLLTMRRSNEVDGSLLLDRVMLFAGVFVSVSLVSLVVLGIVGAFTPVAVVLVSLVPALVAGVLTARHHTEPTLKVPGLGATLAVGSVIAVIAAFNVLFVSEHMSTIRDAGVYLTIARWLSVHGDLLMEGRTDPFGGLDWVTANWNAYYEIRSDGLLYAQFLHAFPAVLAALRWVFGDGVLFHANTVIFIAGFSSAYLLVTQFVRDWIAALTVSITAVTVVAFYFARATYSEPLMLLLLVLGLIAFYIGLKARSSFAVIVAGMAIGATAMVRIDGWVLIGGFIAASALLAATLSPAERWPLRRVAVVFLTPFVVGSVGMIDGIVRTPGYIVDHMRFVAAMLALVATTAVIAVGLMDRSYNEHPSFVDGKRWLETHESKLRLFAGWAVVATAGFLLFIRPIFFVATRPSARPNIGSALALEGHLGGARRTLAELTGRWFTWYWGWVGVALVVAGLLVLLWTRRPIRRRSWDRAWFVIMISGPLLAAYMLSPSITPDHPWAMRRFYAAALILVPLLQGVAFEWMARLSESSAGVTRFVRRSIFVAAAAAALVVPIIVSAPLLKVGPQDGLRASVSKMCSTMPEDPAVIVHGDSLAFLGAAIRSFCDVPTVATVSDLEIPEIGNLALSVVDRGYGVVLLTETETVPEGWKLLAYEVTEYPQDEFVLLRAPEGAISREFSWFASVPGSGSTGTP